MEPPLSWAIKTQAESVTESLKKKALLAAHVTGGWVMAWIKCLTRTLSLKHNTMLRSSDSQPALPQLRTHPAPLTDTSRATEAPPKWSHAKWPWALLIRSCGCPRLSGSKDEELRKEAKHCYSNVTSHSAGTPTATVFCWPPEVIQMSADLWN